jgi:hypothetical protein
MWAGAPARRPISIASRTGPGSGRRARTGRGCDRSRRSAPPPRQGGELLGRGKAARRVVEPGAETDCALLQPLAEECPHPVECAGVGRHVVPAECRDAERRVADQRGDVQAGPAVVAAKEARHRVPVMGDRRIAVEAGVHLDHRVEVLAAQEGREADPVDADHLGRDPLADLRLVARVVEDDEPAVTVQVDEPGRDDLPVASIVRRRRGLAASREQPEALPVHEHRAWASRRASPPSTTVPPTIATSSLSATRGPPLGSIQRTNGPTTDRSRRSGSSNGPTTRPRVASRCGPGTTSRNHIALN